MSIQFLFLQEHHKLYPDVDILKLSEGRISMFDKVCGTSQIREKFFENYNYADIKNILNNDIDDFKHKIRKYLIY